MKEDKAMTDDQLRNLFQEMRDEPVPADSLARVCAGVSQRIESRRVFPLRWAAALVAVGVFIAVLVWHRPEAPVAAPEPIVPLEVEHVPAPPPLPAPAKPKPRIVSKSRPKSKPSTEVVFRIQTEDPEVVILLVN